LQVETCPPFPIFIHSGVKSVVIVGQPDLRHIEPALCTPFSDIDPHVHGSEEPFDPAGRLSLEAIGQGGKKILPGILEIGHRRPASLFLTEGDHRLQTLRFRGDHLLDDLLFLHPGAYRADFKNLAQDVQPVLALAGHLFLVFPKDELQLMRHMPQTALDEDRDLALETVQDRGVAVGQEKEVLERPEGLQAGLEQLVPAAVVWADIYPSHPDPSTFPVLDEHLQLLAPLLDPVDPNPRAVRFSPGFFLWIQGERDLLGRLLHGLPYCHLVERPPEGRHDLRRHPVGRERSDEPQLPEHLPGNPCSGFKTQQGPGDIELVRAAFALDLKLLQDDPLEGRQDLRLLAVPGLPDELPVVAAFATAERFHAPGHGQFSISDQGLLEKVRQDLR